MDSVQCILLVLGLSRAYQHVNHWQSIIKKQRASNSSFCAASQFKMIDRWNAPVSCVMECHYNN